MPETALRNIYSGSFNTQTAKIVQRNLEVVMLTAFMYYFIFFCRNIWFLTFFPMVIDLLLPILEKGDNKNGNALALLFERKKKNVFLFFFKTWFLVEIFQLYEIECFPFSCKQADKYKIRCCKYIFIKADVQRVIFLSRWCNELVRERSKWSLSGLLGDSLTTTFLLIR